MEISYFPNAFDSSSRKSEVDHPAVSFLGTYQSHFFVGKGKLTRMLQAYDEETGK